VDITEVRIKLTEDLGERLKAFCSVTFDNCFVVRDLKIIEGANGPFVAMPSRKLTFHCPECRSKNHLRAAYCNQCGRSLREYQPPADEEGRIKLYADIAHPINAQCREQIQDKVISAYQQETEQAKQPGYVPHYDDYDDDWEYDSPSPAAREGAESAPQRALRKTGDRAGAPEPGRTRDESEPPRGPHKKPEQKPAGAPQRREPPDAFGAGIF
jgi:stage V sporulation protein G